MVESYVICEVCGEKSSTNFKFCSNCGTDLSFNKESPDSTKTNLITVPLTGSSSAQRMIELVVNISYVVFTLGLLVIILATTVEICTHQGLLILLPSHIIYIVVPHIFESTLETMFRLIFGLCLVTWLSIMRYGS